MSTIMDRVIALIHKDALARRDSAGYGGRSDDGGASELEAQVKFFLYGFSNKMPPEWKKYEDQAIKETDSEYKEYLRLKNKFEKI